MIVAARALLIEADTWFDGGGLVVEGGLVRRVLRTRRAVERARARRSTVVEHDGLLTPGLVNAHAHLELGAMHRRLPRGGGFQAWIAALLRLRAELRAEDLTAAVRAGLRQSLHTGTTAVGDIDSSGASARLPAAGPHRTVYTEVLDAWDDTRTDAALRRAGTALRRRPSSLRRPGLSPHAPYTTSRALLAGVARLARERVVPMTIHWAETAEEGQWLRSGRGPFAAILPAPPRVRGLDLLEATGVLRLRPSLVHGNHPTASELELLARRRITVVHCPGTHAFFGRARFPLRRYAAAGVALALGTDSLASNDALDMRREMALLRETHPRLAPEEVLAMATRGSARALGLPGAGHLRVGARADLVAWDLVPRSRREALEALTAGLPEPRWTRVRGRRPDESRL